MTVGIAWVGKRRDGREHLYVATDSRTRGAYTFDSCPKILTLPRSDCALGFAGSTSETYPLMLQMAYAIAAHEPASDRSLDIVRVKEHLLRIFTDLIQHHDEPATPLTSGDAQFLFAGYSWRSKDYRIWTINYSEREKKFVAREARTFISRLRKAAFIGDWATRLRNKIASEFGRAEGTPLYLEPLTSISDLIAGASKDDSIGGPPQLIRITEHMNTRPLCVRWKDHDTLFGRPLFDYENIDYWMVDPATHRFQKPRKFGNRSQGISNDGEDEHDLEGDASIQVIAPVVE